MKVVLNIIKTILAFLFGVVSCIFILAYTILNTTEDLLSKDNIINTVKSVDIVQLIGEERKQEMYAILQKANVPTEYVDYMLEDEKLKETIGEYTANSLDYILYDKELPTIDATEIKDILITSFDNTIALAEQNQIDVSNYISKENQIKIREKIEYYVPEIVEKIPDVQEYIETKINEDPSVAQAKSELEKLQKTIDTIQTIYSYKNLLLVGVILPLVFIILLKLKRMRFLKWLAFPFVLASILFKFICTMIPYILNNLDNTLAKFEDIIAPSIEIILTRFNQITIFCFLVGLSLIILQIVIKIYLKNKDKEEKIVL